MSDSSFISYGQNREDVVLWRALGSLPHGRYVEVGANDPTTDSISRFFYDSGWSGLTIEPDPELAARHRAERPRDTMVEGVVSSRGATALLHRFVGTGLSTLEDSIGDEHVARGRVAEDIDVASFRLDQVVADHGLDTGDVHFLIVDVEGAEADVLSTVHLTTWRPWILVIEATLPNSTEPSHAGWEPDVLAAGYTFCLFDGVSRFYVADEHAAALRTRLSYPACAHDDFVDHDVKVVRDHEASLVAALATSSQQAAALVEQTADLREQTAALGDQVTALDSALSASRERWMSETLRWRRAALGEWASRAGEKLVVGHTSHEMTRVQSQLEDARKDAAALRRTVSWRVTSPLRAVRTRTGGRR